MPDLDHYTEPVAALTNPIPALVVVAFQSAAEYRTVPGELVAPGLVIAPEVYCSGTQSLQWPGGGRTRGWRIVHVHSGLRIAAARFLPWARELALRLACLPGVTWTDSADRIHAHTNKDALSRVLAEYDRREDHFWSLAHSDDPADTRYLERELQLLGATNTGAAPAIAPTAPAPADTRQPSTPGGPA